MRSLAIVILFSLLPATAAAQSLTADGVAVEVEIPARSPIVDLPWLVHDGDFENFTCLQKDHDPVHGPGWRCETDNGMDWIADLVPLGLWNYSGNHIAWLGGFSEGHATCFTSFCQEIYFSATSLIWFWMAYVNHGAQVVNVSIDGNLEYSYQLELADHLLDYQPKDIDVDYPSYGLHELCFWTENPDCGSNVGDNYFIDFVELLYHYDNLTRTEHGSFSTVKSRY